MPRTLLKADDFAEASALLSAPTPAPDGDTSVTISWSGPELSRWIVSRLRAEWEKDEDFEAAAPLLLGSGARDEITLRSDVDLFIAGDEAAGGRFIGRLQASGLKVRARVPENPIDWTAGAEIEDHLALLEARPLTSRALELFEARRGSLAAKARRKRRTILAKISKDQRERRERHDSIANFLEPNLKYGPGGLRDLDQARQLARLFPEKFSGGEHAMKILDYYSAFWLTLRHRLHLEGQNDVLMSAAQFDLARWMGVSQKDLMRQVQRGLSRVSFYATWISEKARASAATLERIEGLSWEKPEQLVRALEKDTSVLVQHRVRANLERLLTPRWQTRDVHERGELLARVLRPGAPEDFVRAVFSSRLIDRLCPEIIPLVGYVQHDQYHRYSADTHLQQACVEYQRTLKRPRRLGPLATEVRALTASDRWILAWTMLFHDIMKGREVDHSEEGTRWVRRELARFAIDAATIDEVAWLVENHLILSQAAFRQNPQSPETWKSLGEKGVVGARLRRLAVFTAVDILATNPEAWTPWKARLLGDLVRALESPSVKAYQKWSELARVNKLPPSCLELDSFLLEHLPLKKLAEDLRALSKSSGDTKPLLWSRGGQVWIRFHRSSDQPGLFAEFVRRLYDWGLNVRHASVHTLEGVGVYDWFQVSSKRGIPVLRKWLELPASAPRPAPRVHFDRIQWVSRDEREWIVSFQGLDQPGFLAAAATALAEQGCSIQTARVHTWGRRVDDLFHLKPGAGPEDPVAAMQKMVATGG